MGSSRPVKVIAVTGGKGGVGKTNVSVNMSLALGEMGHRVVLMDADLGLANVDVLLGVKAKRNISDVLSGECHLKDLLIDVDTNVRIVPAASGTQAMTSLSVHEHSELIHAFSEIADDLDILVIDTAAGISEAVVSFVKAAQDVVVVVCDEPTSITDAYALMKLLNRDYKMTRFRVLANMVRSEQEGRNMYNKLLTVTDRFLDVTLQYLGSIPYDEAVRKGVKQQRAVLKAFPQSKAALAYKQLATKVDAWPMPSSSRGHLEFFVERLITGA
ncbi:MinD/ParA family protein [Amphritea sp. 2_MG-2023]|jgi:flagellar biosynthesis protein FlhG|uniref:MinD/ParA family protein n=1 Tax=Amphritea TaxID=515417 RepID=UPI001C07A5BB|nr:MULTISPECIES: MinD/ParA family protein [Amphritea]MBU2964806.1 MinD/ParA family protein [Amphritea atlantica]MDO6419619.1 MinD/ParA family protein [Amphritea sp. 2_MG-2023]MDX2421902.1 MinD/ParA family protein [Amphritea sp.]